MLYTFGPIVAVIAFTALLRPGDDADAETSGLKINGQVPGVPAVPNVPAVPSVVRDGSGLVLTGVKEELEHTCSEGEHVVVKGTKNQVELDGECASVTIAGLKNELSAESVRAVQVDGTKNSVRVESTATITVRGVKNEVRYGDGLDGAPPKVVREGLGNEVRRQ